MVQRGRCVVLMVAAMNGRRSWCSRRLARLTVGWGCHGWGARRKNSRSVAEVVVGEEVTAVAAGDSGRGEKLGFGFHV
ncbi:hypothetical protein DEO72_LG1g2238 [Vigna unguiculata]|uniref:Uncharacterized protein n=1 Tax=Vigna unguiculata TaxID=3917 RepID=A0A4D6KM68_VIGUN|nr:hypothetical protein DEO72_LG1g2238 [Vigna unguiculata]